MRQLLDLKRKHGHDVAGFSTSSRVQRSENAVILSKRVRQRVTVAADTSCIRCSPPSANIDLNKSILKIVLRFARLTRPSIHISSNTMLWPNYLSIILPAAFSTIHALNLPTPLNQTVELPDWQCSTRPFRNPPLYRDCEVAYRELPRSINRGIFHQMGEEDGYKLPVERSSNTCTVTVTLLAEGRQEKGSWAEIVSKAAMLNHICVNGINDGGYIMAGQYGRIWVMLMSASAGNRTVDEQVDVT